MRIIYTSLLLFLLNNLFGQVIHFDKAYYFSGEHILYALHLPEHFGDQTSAAISLHSKQGLIAKHHRISDQGVIHGYVKLPFNLPSSQYILQVHMFKAETLEPVLIFSNQIPIYNDSELASLIKLDKVNTDIPLLNSNEINIKCDAEEVETRSDLTCSVEGFKDEVFSLAIKEESIPLKVESKNGLQMFNANEYSDKIVFYGRRKYDQSNQINNPLILSILPDDLKFAGTLANDNGDFALPLPNVFGNHDLQFYDHLNLNFNIEKIDIPKPDETLFQELKISDEIIEQLQDYQKRKTIYQLFNQLDQTIDFPSVSMKSQKIEPDYDLWVADYNVKGSLGDLFVEVFTPLKYRKDKSGKYIASMMYEQGRLTKFYDKKTLFIVNGQLTTDDHFVGAMPIHLVESMSIYSNYEKLIENFGKGALRGVVEIEMKDASYVLPDDVLWPQFQIVGIQKPLIYPLKFVQDAQEIPQLRPLIYWNPVFNNQEEHSFTFRTSDDPGKYHIELIGMDGEGKPIYIKHVIKVIESLKQ